MEISPLQERVDYQIKRATVMSALRKVDVMASNLDQRIHSGLAKLKEFMDLEYPPGILKFMCSIIGRDSGHREWFSMLASLPSSRREHHL